ncbi:B3 domain-containing transcription factor VRN1 isoform X2 [Eucalyptus grandis]|uniref:B3 domain-containing transcription factor VRN1 isoform X2 n=1 Tax=Eucalyptus grandis TaxID=71139 RepID=UPI00192EA63A|nr:B3 domain-containing transcription factor VRN1 isoform X2 [Eucalyptus grandis]
MEYNACIESVGYSHRRFIMPCRRQRRRREDEGAEQEMTPASPPSSPHFFKVILSRTLESGKLEIPKRFLRRYGKDLSGSVLLKVPGGSTWPVKLEKSSHGMVWLCKGWRTFMEHYSIGDGHLVVFKYEGDSIFHVMIFDKSASEIDYPLSNGSDVSTPEGKFVSRTEENVMEIEDSEGLGPCSWPSSNGSSREFGGARPVAALELASEFKSEHPFFKVVLWPTYVNRYMGVPSEFFRKHLRKSEQMVTLKCSDRLWQVKLKSYKPRDTAVLSTGWSLFARETGLRARDVCVFELTDRDNIVFEVSIFSSDGQSIFSNAEVICID